MSYIGRSPGFGIRNRYYYTATAAQTTFSGADDNGQTLAYADSKYLDVFLNGVLLVAGTDYTATTLTSVTLTSGASASDIIEIVAYDIFSVADTVSSASGGTFNGAVTFDAGLNTDTISEATSGSGVTIDGVLLKDGGISVSSGTIKLDGNYPVGTQNVALGDAALDSVASDGNYNTAVGHASLTANTTGDANSAFGRESLLTNSTGNYNTAVGYTALLNNTTAQLNTAVGYQAGYSTTTGVNNTFVGEKAGYANTTGDRSSYFGSLAGNATTGRGNTFIGCDAGYLVTTGAENTILGRYTGNYGGLDIRTSSNYIVLSDGDGNPRLYLNGQFLFCEGVYNGTTGSAVNVRVETSGQIRRSTSSLRYKNTVNDATHGLTELLQLRPVTFKGNDDDMKIVGGLIAEEVHDAGLTEFVDYDDQNRPDALAYGNMVSLCIKAIQELKTENDSLKARIEALENQ